MLKAHGLQWHGWHACRRGLATNLKEMGCVDDVTIQAILRHQDVRTTQRFYIKTAAATVQNAMHQFGEKIGCATGWVSKLAQTHEYWSRRSDLNR